MSLVPRLSPSSRLVVTALVVAFVLVGVAGSIRDGSPAAAQGTAQPTPTTAAFAPSCDADADARN